jgi:hypothetical protein
VLGLPTRTANLENKLYRDNFSSCHSFNDLYRKTINCCGSVRPNQKVMPSDFGRKLRLKQGDIKTEVKTDLAAVACKGKQYTNVLTNMDHPQADGNICG